MLNFNQPLNRNCLANAHQSVDDGQTGNDFLCFPLFSMENLIIICLSCSFSMAATAIPTYRWNVPDETKRKNPKM